MKRIWVLFSIIDDYNQPDANMVAWWENKPTFEMVATAMGIGVNTEVGNSKVRRVLRGKEVGYKYANYRLRYVGEGIYGNYRGK